MDGITKKQSKITVLKTNNRETYFQFVNSKNGTRDPR